jgi:hypothetical protein
MISNELYEGIPPALFAARQSFAIYAGCETWNKAFEVLINVAVATDPPRGYSALRDKAGPARLPLYALLWRDLMQIGLILHRADVKLNKCLAAWHFSRHFP